MEQDFGNADRSAPHAGDGDLLGFLVDHIALLYHEARNVRHLIRADFHPSKGWDRVVSLPTNRLAAWREIQDTREEAKAAGNTEAALAVFEGRFQVSLIELREMFANEHWRHAQA